MDAHWRRLECTLIQYQAFGGHMPSAGGLILNGISDVGVGFNKKFR